MFKIKIDPAKVAALEAKVKRDIIEIISADAVLNEVGDMVVERLRYQARTEQPINKNGSFPNLQDSTVQHRKYLAKYNKTHGVFEPGTSNLTITGAFLNALTYLVKGPGLLEIFFEGTHPGYHGKNGKIKAAPVKNSDLFKWLKLKGFTAFDSAIGENKTLRSRVMTIVRGYIRRGLKVRNG